jgi:hypothetical protein
MIRQVVVVGILRIWRKIHWSDASRFLLHVTDGRMRIWRHKNTAYTPRNIQPTVPYGGGSVMGQCCLSTGLVCEWHPSNQTLQCPVVTIRCYSWSAGSWQVFLIVGLCVFSHQSADCSIVVAYPTSNSGVTMMSNID